MQDRSSDYRFEIAISFAGDNKRDQVRRVAEILRDELGEGKVFFDEWFEAEIAGPDAHVVLQNIYRKQARLVATCFCQGYQEKPWTQDEWRAIQSLERTLRDAGSENLKRMRFLPLRFGDGDVDGLFDTAIVPDVRDRSPEQIADLILQRLRLSKGESVLAKRADGPAPSPTREEELRYLGRLRREIEEKADLYSPLRGIGTKNSEQRVSELLHAWKDDPDLALLRHRPRAREAAEPSQTSDYDDILKAFGEVKQAALLGDPGAGKSTTLRKLAIVLAETAEKNPDAPLPLLANLGDWRGDETLADFLAERIPEVGRAAQTLSESGRVVLLLDGLNEVPTAKRADKAADLLSYKDELAPGTPFIVSCRSNDYVGDLALRVDTLSLDPLSPQRVRAVLQKWVADSGKPSGSAERLFWQLAGDENLAGVLQSWLEAGSTEDAFWTASDATNDEKARDSITWRQKVLWRQHVPNPRSLLSLAANPFMLTMIYQNWVAFEGELPSNRGELFEQFVNRLLRRERLLDPKTGVWRHTVEGERLLAGLAELAWRMQSDRSESAEGSSGDFGVLTVVSREDAAEMIGGEVLLKKARDGTLLEGDDEIRFRHQLLQEYFTARALERRLGDMSARELWPREAWWERAGWEEACVLLAGFRSDDCGPIIRWLADTQPEVAAQCIEESGAEVGGRDALVEELHDAWMPRLADIDREPAPEARAAIGRALGRLNLDDRKGVGLRADGLPDIDWVEIPGGKFPYGEDKEQREIETFQMARYPVTNAQFRAFVDAEDGYGQDLWWRGLDDPDRTVGPPEWDEPNHPRETVSWHEAMAFCAWLSEKLGMGVRLPTEEQWERAARGVDGWEYPWGDGYGVGRANIDEKWGKVGPHRIGRTTAVGIYPHGVSPEGALDLSGNVWEWCLNEYDNPKRIQPGGKESRVLRGGSWGGSRDSARAGSRFSFRPGFRNYSIGFRVVSSSPIQR